MSALGSSSLKFDPAGFPLLQSLGANLVLVANTYNDPGVVLARVPKTDIYNCNLRGFINGGANAITRIGMSLFSDIACTELLFSQTIIVPLGALQGDPCPINMNFTTRLTESGADPALYALTARIVAFGAGGTIYNAMPNDPAAGQGLAFYWQSDTGPMANPRRIPDFIEEMP